MRKEKVIVKKWYRSRRDRMIAGVCGGLAELLGIDSTLVRFIWGITVFFGGFGIFAYILAMIVIPEAPEGEPLTHDVIPHRISTVEWGVIFGLFIILIGALLLLGNLLDWRIWYWGWRIIVPLILIGFGVYLIIRSRR
ncbi:MAG: PspC domain-containing protein [Coprothermobacterota bacterium]|nr:PspC domain-containing protein [Coprothermobacterota bacterium]